MGLFGPVGLYLFEFEVSKLGFPVLVEAEERVEVALAVDDGVLALELLGGFEADAVDHFGVILDGRPGGLVIVAVVEELEHGCDVEGNNFKL